MNKNCRYLLILIITVVLQINPVFSDSTEILSKIENDIYGFEYTNDKVQNRILRLEKTIYGKGKTGDINKRIKALSNDISADMIGLEINPVRDTFLAEEDEEMADSSVQYPIVDEIEKTLFNTTYKNRDFHTRIVTIEKKLFGKIYDVDDYSKRMERIKSKMYPETLANQTNNEFNNGSYYNNEELSSFNFEGKNRNRFKMPFGQRNYTRPYTNFGSYESDLNNTFTSQNNLNDNLSQMEYDMFGTEFSSDDTNTRIKRLNSANQAKKSSHKYDSNKFSQHMSTAMEIGAMILMILAMVL